MLHINPNYTGDKAYHLAIKNLAIIDFLACIQHFKKPLID